MDLKRSRWAIAIVAAAIASLVGIVGCGGGGSSESGSEAGEATVSVRALSAGWHHSCAVVEMEGGETRIKCWGSNAHGELGNGTRSYSTTPVTVMDGDGTPLTGVVSVSASRYYTCALLSSGGVKCWGWNEGGKLGDGKVDKTIVDPLLRGHIPFENEVNVTKAVTVLKDANQPLSGVKQISAGSWHACALLSDETVACWGQNFDGALGIGKSPEDFDPTAAKNDSGEFQKLFWPYAVKVVESNTSTAPLSHVKQVAAGSSDHTCALLKDGTVRCWAWNGGEDGELGIDDTHTTFVVAPAEAVHDTNGSTLRNVKKIAAGGDFTCALLNDGHVKCWGWNVDGQLGNDSNISVPHAVAVLDANGSELSGVEDIVSERGNHTCAIIADRHVKCWGDNTHGQLGDGRNGGYVAHAVDVALNAEVASLAVGGGGRDPLSSAPVQYDGDHTCALTVGGELYCWGANEHGQLGDGTTTDRAEPVRVQGL